MTNHKNCPLEIQPRLVPHLLREYCATASPETISLGINKMCQSVWLLSATDQTETFDLLPASVHILNPLNSACLAHDRCCPLEM